VLRWPGSGAALVTVRIGAVASAITPDRHGGLWVITEDMHVRRCRDMLCEDTGRVLPFAAQSAVTAQAAPERDALGSTRGRRARRARSHGQRAWCSTAVWGRSTSRATERRSSAQTRAPHCARSRHATTLGETRAPIDFDALYATSAGDLWINAASAITTASLLR
jgi:hypothetical protein